MRIVTGIDGGGTKTRAALVAEDGAVLGVGIGGPSNYDDVGVATAKQNIEAALQSAWREAGQPSRNADAAFLGMAGVVSDTDRAAIHGIANDLGLAPATHVGVDHDIRISLAGSLGGREGITLIVGTGSACYGRRSDGRNWRAGGWAHLLDDMGSGYYLGLHAMIAAVRATDGRGPETALTRCILNALELQDMQDIMRRLYHDGMDRAEIAALAPLVIQVAAEGDGVAREIIARGADELALMVETVARKLGPWPQTVSVSVTGGVAQSGPIYRKPLDAAIQRQVPTAEIQEPLLSPVLGAALLALEMIGILPTAELVRQMQRGRQP